MTAQQKLNRINEKVDNYLALIEMELSLAMKYDALKTCLKEVKEILKEQPDKKPKYGEF